MHSTKTEEGAGDLPHSNVVQCEFCDQTFYGTISLGRHKVFVHQDKATHECKECGKKFLESNYLHRHEKKQHGKAVSSEEFPCQKCGKILTSRKALLEHEFYVCKINHDEKMLPASVRLRRVACTFPGCTITVRQYSLVK